MSRRDEAREPVGRSPCCRGRGSRCARPRPRDADAARRIGLHPEILRLFGDEPDEEWRELTREESEELLEALASDRGPRDLGRRRGRAASSAPRRCTASAATGRRPPTPSGCWTPTSLGRGLGTEVTRLVLAHAFDDLGLGELTVRVLEFNSRAIGCYAALRVHAPAPRAGRGHARRRLVRGRDHAPRGRSSAAVGRRPSRSLARALCPRRSSADGAATSHSPRLVWRPVAAAVRDACAVGPRASRPLSV